MISGREIAFPIEACVTMLLECGMQEEVGTSIHTHPHPSISQLTCSSKRLGLQVALPCSIPTLDS